jgi:hypothetical protein
MRVRTMVFSSSSRCLDGFELEEEVVGRASFVGVEDEPIGSDVQDRVAVQAVLPTLEEAKAEVERLNATRDPERVVYVWRATRFYPEGRKSSSGGSSAASGSDPVDR